MIKDFSRLQTTQYDLVVVGGGIHGATLAYEAARAGYKVALLEKGDFSGSTSANSLKIVHGGIRYLQHGDFKRMRESIVSRRRMMVLAPHLVKPLSCLMPTYGHGIKGRETMRLAFAIYDLIAFDRNQGLAAENHLPCGSSISREEVKWVVPGIVEKGLSGGAVWYDAIALDTERLVLEYLKEAVRYGAHVANYAEVAEVEMAGGWVAAVMVRDLQTDREMRVGCRAVVNAAGPWLENLTGRGGGSGVQLWATALNIVVKKRLFEKYAVGLEGYTDFTDKDALIKRGKRLFFFVPWQDRYTMIGTTYTQYHGAADNFSLTLQEVEKVLEDINKIYQHGRLNVEDVTFFHAGLLPIKEADASKADSVQLDKSSMIIEHGLLDGRNGLFSIKGVKYTTAPVIAEKMVKILAMDRWLGQRAAGIYQALPPRNLDFGPAITQLGGQYEAMRAYLVTRYGTSWRDVFAFFVQRPLNEGESFWLLEDPPLLVAEVLYFIYEEMAATLADIVFRRTNLAAAECPTREVLARIAGFMGGELDWSAEEQKRQIEKVEQVFAILIH
ncbi:MAG: glycerol-3-phosphate dehydrogenase/oxidase [Proteobacteria bacterium]|nr:glycerol-3-phosphate dehydrogenase/oxidase [Pseudomonadota bacterium]